MKQRINLMSFTKKMTFTDKLDEEIYCFRLMLNLAENAIGKCNSMVFMFKNYEIDITNANSDEEITHHFLLTVRVVGVGLYDVSEIAGGAYLDVMNGWFNTHAMIVRNPDSEYYGKFSITNGNEEFKQSDELLDSYLLGGINKMPEDVYFQESLVRDDHMYAHEDIDRILDVLNTESDLKSSFFHHKVPGWTALDYNELYDKVMEICNDTK